MAETSLNIQLVIVGVSLTLIPYRKTGAIKVVESLTEYSIGECRNQPDIKLHIERQ